MSRFDLRALVLAALALLGCEADAGDAFRSRLAAGCQTPAACEALRVEAVARVRACSGCAPARADLDAAQRLEGAFHGPAGYMAPEQRPRRQDPVNSMPPGRPPPLTGNLPPAPDRCAEQRAARRAFFDRCPGRADDPERARVHADGKAWIAAHCERIREGKTADTGQRAVLVVDVCPEEPPAAAGAVERFHREPAGRFGGKWIAVPPIETTLGAESHARTLCQQMPVPKIDPACGD